MGVIVQEEDGPELQLRARLVCRRQRGEREHFARRTRCRGSVSFTPLAVTSRCRRRSLLSHHLAAVTHVFHLAHTPMPSTLPRTFSTTAATAATTTSIVVTRLQERGGLVGLAHALLGGLGQVVRAGAVVEAPVDEVDDDAEEDEEEGDVDVDVVDTEDGLGVRDDEVVEVGEGHAAGQDGDEDGDRHVARDAEGARQARLAEAEPDKGRAEEEDREADEEHAHVDEELVGRPDEEEVHAGAEADVGRPDAVLGRVKEPADQARPAQEAGHVDGRDARVDKLRDGALADGSASVVQADHDNLRTHSEEPAEPAAADKLVGQLVEVARLVVGNVVVDAEADHERQVVDAEDDGNEHGNDQQHGAARVLQLGSQRAEAHEAAVQPELPGEHESPVDGQRVLRHHPLRGLQLAQAGQHIDGNGQQAAGGHHRAEAHQPVRTEHLDAKDQQHNERGHQRDGLLARQLVHDPGCLQLVHQILAGKHRVDARVHQIADKDPVGVVPANDPAKRQLHPAGHTALHRHGACQLDRDEGQRHAVDERRDGEQQEDGRGRAGLQQRFVSVAAAIDPEEGDDKQGEDANALALLKSGWWRLVGHLAAALLTQP
eukprot:m.49291 g.49291  ORF g.49291 m.49291 type:complete len:602 (-) comp12808_c0_seq1:110-1915(-)